MPCAGPLAGPRAGLPPTPLGGHPRRARSRVLPSRAVPCAVRGPDRASAIASIVRGRVPAAASRKESTLSANRPTSNSAARRERRAAERSRRPGGGGQASGGSGGPSIPGVLRSPLGLITAAVVVLAAVGLVFVLVGNVVGGGQGGALVAPADPAPLNLAHGRSIGNASAPVKLDEWEDFQCPYCDNYSVNVEPHLISQYVTTGQVEITYHDFTFIGPASFDASVAARCAGNQGQFWAYMEYLFANQGPENGGWANRSLFDRIANAVGVNQATFDQCLSDPSMLAAVKAETAQGQNLGIQGTPTLFINGKQYTGSIDLNSISSALDAALRSAPSASPSAGASSPAAPGSSAPSSPVPSAS